MVTASSELCNEFQERSGYELEFPRNVLVAFHDTVLKHRERYQYPNKETPGTTTYGFTPDQNLGQSSTMLTMTLSSKASIFRF